MTGTTNGAKQTSGNDETKPFFWSFCAAKKKRSVFRSALDRLRFNESTEAFFWSQQK